MPKVNVPPIPDYGPEVHSDETVEEPAVNARQGISGQNVRYVLRFGVLGVVIALALVYLFYFA